MPQKFSILIVELAERSRLKKDTVRLYEKKRLIRVDRGGRRDNDYKEYSGQVLEQLRLIRKLKDMGFTVNEIGSFFGL